MKSEKGLAASSAVDGLAIATIVELYNRADCVEWNNNNNNNNTKEKRVRISVRDRGRPGFCTVCLSSVCRIPPASLSLSLSLSRLLRSLLTRQVRRIKRRRREKVEGYARNCVGGRTQKE